MTGLASRSQLRSSYLRWALFTVPLVLFLGTLSGRLAGSGYGNPWFDALAKPDLMPPGWVFGVAWTALYILLGLSLAMVLNARGAEGRTAAIALFLAQLALNYAWSPVFFAFHRVGTALIILLVMIGLTVGVMLLFRRIRPVAALLLLPYLAWLCFAAWLTFDIGRLNPEAAQLAPDEASSDIAF
jgi:tryptophan-rich sensory protein